MAILVIVESSEKAKKIGQILGPQYWVRASIGHIRDLPPKDLGVDLQTFQPTYATMAEDHSG
ncbi:toprim domain-containing protein [Pseudomonas sp. Qb1D1]